MPNKKISELNALGGSAGSFSKFIPIEDTVANVNYKVSREQVSSLIATSNGANLLPSSATVFSGSSGSLAIGDFSIAGNLDSITIGSAAEGNVTPSAFGGDITIGTQSISSADKTITIGKSSSTTASSAITIGSNISNNYTKSILIGNDITNIGSPLATPESSVIIGNLAQSNSFSVAIGAEATSNYQNVAIGAQANADSDIFGGAISIGYLAEAIGINNLAIGKTAYSAAPNGESIAIGTSAQSSADNSVTIGAYSEALSEESVAVGAYSSANLNSVAIGSQANANIDGTAVGQAASAGVDGVAIGQAASSEDNSIALGKNSIASAFGSIAIGANAEANALSAIQLGAGINSIERSFKYATNIIATVDGGIKASTEPDVLLDVNGADYKGTFFYDNTGLQIYDGLAWQPVSGSGGSDSQTLSISGQQLTISNGNTITLPSSDSQTLSISGQQLSISNGNTITLPSGGADNQTLSRTGLNLSISNGNTIALPTPSLTISGQQLTINNGNTITLPSGGGGSTYGIITDTTAFPYDINSWEPAGQNNLGILTGLSAGVDGQKLVIQNNAADYSSALRISREASSTAANRIRMNTSRELICKNETMEFTYNAAQSRWIGVKLGAPATRFRTMAARNLSFWYPSSTSFNTVSLTTGNSYYAPFVLDSATDLSSLSLLSLTTQSFPTLTVNIYTDNSDQANAIQLGDIVMQANLTGPFTAQNSIALTTSLAAYLPAGSYWLGYTFSGSAVTLSYGVIATGFRNYMPVAETSFLSDQKMFTTTGTTLAAAGTTLSTTISNYPNIFLY